MPFPGYREAMKRATNYKEEELDLNVTLEDDVFLPGPAPPGTRKPWRVDPSVADSYKEPAGCCPKYNTFRHLPNIYGKVHPDPLIGSNLVMRVNDHNYLNFLNSKNKVLIMFYQSVNDKLPANTEWSKNQLITAAETTKRGRYGYGAIDCTRDAELCADMRDWELNRGVKEFPFFNVFEKTNPIASISDYKTFDATRMKEYVEEYTDSGSLTAI